MISTKSISNLQNLAKGNQIPACQKYNSIPKTSSNSFIWILHEVECSSLNLNHS